MIRGEHVEDEIKKADAVIANEGATPMEVQKSILKMLTVANKLLRDMKTNQVTQMIRDGIINPEEKPAGEKKGGKGKDTAK